MTTYQTTYSDISFLSKKERKIKENQFPYITPSPNLGKYDPCGQIVSKKDIGSSIKFCPICDKPMIVRMMVNPCEHVFCFECSKPESELCYICEQKIENFVRLNDNNLNLYECDWPDCFKFFTNLDKLNKHKLYEHNFKTEGMGMINPIGMNMNIVMNNRIPGTQNIFMTMPMMPMNPGMILNNPIYSINQVNQNNQTNGILPASNIINNKVLPKQNSNNNIIQN